MLKVPLQLAVDCYSTGMIATHPASTRGHPILLSPKVRQCPVSTGVGSGTRFPLELSMVQAFRDPTGDTLQSSWRSLAVAESVTSPTGSAHASPVEACARSRNISYLSWCSLLLCLKEDKRRPVATSARSHCLAFRGDLVRSRDEHSRTSWRNRVISHGTHHMILCTCGMEADPPAKPRCSRRRADAKR
jgi:hypothetical protein